MLKLPELTTDNISSVPYDDLITLHRGAHRVVSTSADPAMVKVSHDLIAQRLCETEQTQTHGTPLDITRLATKVKLYDNGMQMTQSGLYLKSPHGMLIHDGKKSIIAQGKPDDALLGTHVIVSKENGLGLAFGTATIGEPFTVSHKNFNDYFEQHRVTIAECEKWWADCEQLYLYPITGFTPFAQPREVDVPAGVQMIMEKVEYRQNEVNDMPWTASDAQSHTRAADTPKKREQWAAVANSALAQCLKDGGEKDKCEASAIRQANSVVSSKETDQKAPEEDQTTCVCPNCKAEVEHERGIPCREVECPECNAMMRGSTIDDSDKANDAANADKDLPFAEQADTAEAQGLQTIVPENAIDILAQMIANKLREDHFAFIREPATPTQPESVPVEVEAAPTVAPEQTPEITEQAQVEPVAEAPQPEPEGKSLLSRIKSAIQQLFGSQPTPSILPDIMPSFKVFHNKDTDEDWLVLWTTNSYQDREDETFTIRSIQDYVNRYADQPIKGEFWYAHSPGTKFGTILWQSDVADRFLVQMGPFDDTPVGNTFKEFFSRYPNGHPVIAPVGWGASHGFNYIAEDREDKVYDWFNTIESSVLPRHRAANIHNPNPIFTGGKDIMQDKARAELQTIGESLGVNLLEMIEATAQQRKSELDAVVVHKEIETQPEVQPETQEKEVAESASSEPASATDTTPTVSIPEPQAAPQPDQEQFVKAIVEQVAADLITKVAETFGMESLSETISSLRDDLQQMHATLDKQQGDVQTLTEQLTELARSDDDRLAEKEARLPKFGPNMYAWQRPTQSSANVLAPDDPLTKSVPANVQVPEAVARLSEQR